MNALTILLVEDDPAACRAFRQYAARLGEEVRIVAQTGDASQALRDIKDHLPEVVILDLELHRGSGSGLDVLRGLPSLGLRVSPYVVVTTNNASTVTYDYARELGAGYIFCKYQRGYSEQGVIDFLLPMRRAIHARYGQAPAAPETPAARLERITRRIHSELDNVGVSPKSKGYAYLTRAILLVMEQPRQHLCMLVAREYGVTEASVERAMQNAINRAWQLSDINDLLAHYTARISSDRGVPTVTEFVYYYAKKIGDEYIGSTV